MMSNACSYFASGSINTHTQMLHTSDMDQVLYRPCIDVNVLRFECKSERARESKTKCTMYIIELCAEVIGSKQVRQRNRKQ